MSSPIHPSSDELSAFFDQEATSDQQQTLAAHLAECPECRAVVDGFSALNALGPVIEDRLPGDAYWSDLPDRILARIARDEQAAAAPVPRPEASFWHRLWNPQGAWRLAFGTTAAAVLVAAAWMSFHRPDSPVEPGFIAGTAVPEAAAPRPTAGPELFAATGEPATLAPGHDGPTISAESYNRRVVHTLGGARNLGTSLDIVTGQPVPGTGEGSRLGNQVTYTLPPLSPQSRVEMEGVVSCGPGESQLQTALMGAVKAEETGNLNMARQGYYLVSRATDPADPLHKEANFRLTYLTWKQRILMSPPGPDRARALAELDHRAEKTYELWARSGTRSDCEEAWCLNRTLVRLADEASPQEEIQVAKSRTSDLGDCMNR